MLLPLALYPNAAGMESADLARLSPGATTDPERQVDAIFTVVDSEGRYSCPKCGTDQRGSKGQNLDSADQRLLSGGDLIRVSEPHPERAEVLERA